MTILDELADYARVRTARAKEKIPAQEMEERARALPRGEMPFARAVKKEGMSFICEVKKASPSRGVIAPDFPYLSIAEEYEAAGADAISVLTEPKWFLGSDAYLREITSRVSTPCLRKDFTVDPYMIFETKTLGASAILLICAILSQRELSDYLGIAESLGLSAIVEAHDEKEITMALSAGAGIIGVNNRNLKDFSVDTENSKRLRSLVPPEAVFISESGVRSKEDIEGLREMGVDAVLVGESLMRAGDKKGLLTEWRRVS